MAASLTMFLYFVTTFHNSLGGLSGVVVNKLTSKPLRFVVRIPDVRNLEPTSMYWFPRPLKLHMVI